MFQIYLSRINSSIKLNRIKLNNLSVQRWNILFDGSKKLKTSNFFSTTCKIENEFGNSNNGNSSSKKKYNKPPPIDLKSVRTRRQVEEDDSSSGSSGSSSSSSTSGFTAIVLLSIPILTFILGVWQVQRRTWKLDLIKFLEERTKAPPRELPTDQEQLATLVDNYEYYPFKVKGYFLHSKEILISPKHDLTGTVNLPGGLVITPFVVSNNPNLIIMVNRGFVPYTNYSPLTRRSAQVENEIELVGLLRSNEITNSFTPINKPPNEWHYRDLNQMSQTLGTAPILIDAIESTTLKGGPIGGQTAINLRNEHMSYIVTWFSLSFLTTILWWRRFGRSIF